MIKSISAVPLLRTELLVLEIEPAFPVTGLLQFLEVQLELAEEVVLADQILQDSFRIE